ncbi:MAG: glycerol kinase GlpK [Geminicoccaceae bacterium]
MAKADHILAIDQGTTSSRAIVFDGQGRIIASSQREFEQHFPQSGWVEHDAEVIWTDVLAVSREALAEAGLDAAAIAAIGITNQRETVVLWDRKSGEPVHRAIVWQDRRTADFCRNLKSAGHEPLVQERTGLLLDPYFSSTKLAWLLDNVPGARDAAARGDLAFGTIDSFLLWRLTGGAVHATDATNASRTMLYNIHEQDWDDDLLGLLDIPRTILPEVKDCSTLFGTTPTELFGAPLPVTGIAGDQQAATIGQACFSPGMLKSTYGTGCFALLNTGETAITSTNRLLTTTAYRLKGKPTFAIEGSIFVAGAAVQWLRDQMGLVSDAKDTEAVAGRTVDTGGVYLVPAFVGLGAPYWDPEARGALVGLSRDSGSDQVVRATLESVAYQTQDLMNAMAGDIQGDGRPTAVRVDGGMVANDWVCQFLADVLNLPVERPKVIETTALGAAYLAGLETGLYGSKDAIGNAWQLDRRFEPAMADAERTRLYVGWRDAVSRVRSTG